MSFLEFEAAVAAGLDLWKWESGNYPLPFKARVIAWYNLHSAVESHSSDAAMQKAK